MTEFGVEADFRFGARGIASSSQPTRRSRGLGFCCLCDGSAMLPIPCNRGNLYRYMHRRGSPPNTQILRKEPYYLIVNQRFATECSYNPPNHSGPFHNATWFLSTRKGGRHLPIGKKSFRTAI